MSLDQYKTSEQSISKEDAIKKLKGMGYDAFMDKGVVCITWLTDGNNTGLLDRFRSDAHNIGYYCSIGVVPINNENARKEQKLEAVS